MGAQSPEFCLDVDEATGPLQLPQVSGRFFVKEYVVRHGSDDGVGERQIIPRDELDTVFVPGFLDGHERIMYVNA